MLPSFNKIGQQHSTNLKMIAQQCFLWIPHISNHLIINTNTNKRIFMNFFIEIP